MTSFNGEEAERFFASSRDAIVVLDKQLRIVFQNAPATRILGLGIATWDDARLHHVFAGASFDLTSPVEGPSGREFAISAWPIFASNGAIHWAALRINHPSADRWQSLFEALFDRNQAGASLSTLDGRVIACNRKMADLLGFDFPADVLRQPGQSFFLPGKREEIVSRLKEARELHDVHATLLRADKTLAYVIGSLILVDSPTPEHDQLMLASVIDDSARLHAELAESQSEMRFAEFLHHLPGVAFIKDSQGKYVFCTESAVRGTGRRPEDILGRTDADLWPKSYSSKTREADIRVLREGKPVRVSQVLPGPEGMRHWTIYKFPIPDANGELTLVGGFAVDDTDRLKLEARLHEAEKMEAIGRLAGGVAHDFNNLLTVISGYAQMLGDGLQREVAREKLRTYVDEVLAASRRATSLTDQLLSFGRPKPARLSRVDLRELVEEVRSMLTRVIGEHIELSVEFGAGDCSIDADRGQIEQMLMNLVVNSRDAVPTVGGCITIRAHRNVNPAITRFSEAVVLEVADNGRGMDENTKLHLFEPFFTSKPKGKGTGLGLSTVYGIVRQCGGEIAFESEPGKGSTFHLFFPVSALPAVESSRLEKPVQEKPRGGEETILVVEDDYTVRELVKSMLERYGYTVLSANSGLEALELFGERNEEIAMVLSDVIMPRMSGKDLITALLLMRPQLRFLYMTGYTETELATHGVADASKIVLQKPFTAEVLATRVREILDLPEFTSTC
jgi:two-component system cell cycle sensor histidine kinase/response regulator CckA